MFAVLLALALLSAIVPFRASLSGHQCSMPCCAGGSCSTGACDLSEKAPAQSFKAHSEEPEAASHCAASHHQEQHGAVEVIEVEPTGGDASELHDASQTHESSAALPPNQAQLLRASFGSMAVTQACPSDCCAGGGASSPTRRGREQAIAAQPSGFRPPVIQLYSYHVGLPLAFNSRSHWLTPPRAPPSLFLS